MTAELALLFSDQIGSPGVHAEREPLPRRRHAVSRLAGADASALSYLVAHLDGYPEPADAARRAGRREALSSGRRQRGAPGVS